MSYLVIAESFALFVVWMQRQGRWAAFFGALGGNNAVLGSRGTPASSTSSSASSSSSTSGNVPTNPANPAVGGPGGAPASNPIPPNITSGQNVVGGKLAQLMPQFFNYPGQG